MLYLIEFLVISSINGIKSLFKALFRIIKRKALNKSLLKLKNATVKFFFLLANKKKEGDFFRFGTHERKGQKKSQKKKKKSLMSDHMI